MIRVVIVEDETFVRLGMKMCVEEFDAEMQVIADFGSAEETIEFFEHNVADVLVTDIRLMGMNGLELLQRIKTVHPYLITIIMSCHEDFSYARKALELGVDAYLLKQEIGKDDLPILIKEQYKLKHKFVPEELFTQEVLRDETKKVGFGEVFQVGYFVMRAPDEPYNATKDEMNLYMVTEIFQTLLNHYQIGKCFLHHDTEVLCLFSADDKSQLKSMTEKIHLFFGEAAANIHNYFNKNLYMILSESYYNLKETKQYYQDTISNAIYTIYYEKSAMIDLKCIKSVDRCKEKPVLRLNLSGFFSDTWKSMEKEKIKFFICRCKMDGSSPDDFKDQLIRYFNSLEYHLDESYNGTSFEDIFIKDKIPNHYEIRRYNNCASLETFLLDCLDEIVAYMQKKTGSFHIIEQYVCNHYAEPITLSDVATKFHMNTGYFCQYFKKNKGINYIQFINQIRIDKAKELLLQTSLSTEQISEQVGIVNVNYFFRLFKKNTGMTVGEYRKQ